MQSENLLNKKLQGLKMGPPISNVQGAPAVPKMGVRARVSDWPQRKDVWEARPPPRYDSLVPSFQGGPPSKSSGALLRKSQDLLSCSAFPETRYPLCDLLSHSPMRSLARIKRSNSEVTISDIGAEDIDLTFVNPNTGATLRREYGSTSSLERQGLSAEGFVATVRPCQAERAEQPSAPPPQSFPEPLHFNTSLSPSLQTAAQIARGNIVCIPGYDYVDSSLFYSRERERYIQRMKLEKTETSIFRRLRSVKSEGDYVEQEDGRCSRGLTFQKCFSHYDVQSVLFNISEAVANRADLGRRKNTTTGASAASQCQPGSGDATIPMPIFEPPVGVCDELGHRTNTEPDEGDGKSNNLVLSCPFFRNETGGEAERKLVLTRPNSAIYSGGGDGFSSEPALSHCTNSGVSVLEVSRENAAFPRDVMKRHTIEHVDQGAHYYRKYFYNKDHQNYFGTDENLGPVALSIRREKMEDGKDSQYNYRVIFRTSELTTLRGAILEDAVPSTAKHGTSRGLPLKEVLEYVVPELNIHSLRLANTSPKVPELLLRLDEQALSFQHKVGVLYCRAGQSTEEEMYNNESSGPALDQFLELLGQKVRLKGFSKYRAQLDTKTDSTGTHSLYTTYKDYELMFHVSTLLPHTPNNRQQLLRKRHIGNDIVTVIFQEPGALPFTPKNIRSHFQHIFIIVRVHSPCSDNVCYSVAVTRSKDVPAFGPPIPTGLMFPNSPAFRDFLLTKMINAEHAVHKSDKFRAMAMRTRQEYLKDLAENFITATLVDCSATKFSFITLAGKKKERTRPRRNAHLQSSGAVTWAVVARDVSQSADIGCLLAVSNEFAVLIEETSKEVVFNCCCRDVICWSATSGSVKLFYERGECIVFSAQEGCWDDVREITQRLEVVTRGCAAVEMTLRRNALGQLGFHVNFEGVVADVEPFGFAWQAGLRPGCRLVEICKVTVATLSHEQMIDLLRTSVVVSVVVVHPHKDGTPRRSSSELYRLPLVEYKLEGDGAQGPLRVQGAPPAWHRVTAVPVAPPLSRASPNQGPSPGQQMFHCGHGTIARSTSFDRKEGARMLQDFDLSPSASRARVDGAPLYCSSPSNQSTSSDPGPGGSWQGAACSGCQPAGLAEPPCSKEPEPRLERTRSAEAKWLHPSTKILNMRERSQARKDGKLRRGEQVCSSPSSSNTLSSSASSSSEDKHFGCVDSADAETLGLTYIKGASTDSGIDTAPCMPPPPVPAPPAGSRLVPRDEPGERWALEYPEPGLTQRIKPTASAGNVTDGSLGDLSEISSLSSGSRRSGSPVERRPKSSTSFDSSKAFITSPAGSASGAGLSHPTQTRPPLTPQDGIGWNKRECGSLLEETNRLQSLLTADVQLRPGPAQAAFLRLMLADSTDGGKSLSGVSGVLPASPRQTLYRTLSDESLCSQRRNLSLASSHTSLLNQSMSGDVLFSSTAPYHSTLPPRISRQWALLQKNELCFSDGSLAERSKMADAGLMPLPNTSSHLDWSHLLDAARAFEADQASLCSGSEVDQVQQALELSQELSRRVAATESATLQAGEVTPALLTGKVNQLEEILRQLQFDLQKEQQDKAELQQQVQNLRQDNVRLHQESQTAAAQLRRFTDWILQSVDKRT